MKKKRLVRIVTTAGILVLISGLLFTGSNFIPSKADNGKALEDGRQPVKSGTLSNGNTYFMYEDPNPDKDGDIVIVVCDKNNNEMYYYDSFHMTVRNGELVMDNGDTENGVPVTTESKTGNAVPSTEEQKNESPVVTTESKQDENNTSMQTQSGQSSGQGPLVMTYNYNPDYKNTKYDYNGDTYQTPADEPLKRDWLEK